MPQGRVGRGRKSISTLRAMTELFQLLLWNAHQDMENKGYRYEMSNAMTNFASNSNKAVAYVSFLKPWCSRKEA